MEIEELIAWHRERAAWYERMKPSKEPGREAFYRLRMAHEDTAEHLKRLASYESNDGDGCCPQRCCEG